MPKCTLEFSQAQIMRDAISFVKEIRLEISSKSFISSLRN